MSLGGPADFPAGARTRDHGVRSSVKCRGSVAVNLSSQRLAPYVFVRPGGLRAAEWSEFALERQEPEWRIPAERMKRGEAHMRSFASCGALTSPYGRFG